MRLQEKLQEMKEVTPHHTTQRPLQASHHSRPDAGNPPVALTNCALPAPPAVCLPAGRAVRVAHSALRGSHAARGGGRGGLPRQAGQHDRLPAPLQRIHSGDGPEEKQSREEGTRREEAEGGEGRRARRTQRTARSMQEEQRQSQTEEWYAGDEQRTDADWLTVLVLC